MIHSEKFLVLLIVSISIIHQSGFLIAQMRLSYAIQIRFICVHSNAIPEFPLLF